MVPPILLGQGWNSQGPEGSGFSDGGEDQLSTVLFLRLSYPCRP